jgi:hypothetical protein
MIMIAGFIIIKIKHTLQIYQVNFIIYWKVFYKIKYIAFLTTPILSQKISSLGSLNDDPNLKVFINNNTAAYYYFQSPKFKNLFDNNQILINNSITGIISMIKENPDFGYISTNNVIRYLSSRQPW